MSDAARAGQPARRARPGTRLQDWRAATGRGPVLPTGRGTLLLSLGVFLYAAGANVSSGWTLLVAAACLGAAAWSLLVVHRTGRTITGSRTLPALATTGTPSHVAVGVTGLAGCVAHVLDPATGLVALVGGDADAATGQVLLPRGRVGGEELVVRLTDPLGLAAAWHRLPCGTTTLVLPDAARLAGEDPGTPGGGGERDGGAPATRRDPGPELVGLREHQHGDPLAAVHWRASARRDELVSRDSRQPRQARRDVLVTPGAWDAPALDLATGLVVALGEQGARVGRPVTVCADGARVPWGHAARAHLATLPPAAGLLPRPLGATELDAAAELVRLAPGDGGVVLHRPDRAPVLVPLPSVAPGPAAPTIDAAADDTAPAGVAVP